MEFKADLHTHTSCSDGTMTPIELLKLARDCGLSGLSITDHDTVQAYTKEFFDAASILNVTIICGVEFSCMEKSDSVHILGYGIDIHHPKLIEFCRKHVERREKRNVEMIEKLKKKGFKISYEELLKSKTSPNQILGRPHVAALLLEKGHINTIQEAFERYLGEGKSCYVETKCFNVSDTIDLIHSVGGAAILAHPHLIKKKRLLKDLLRKPFDGMECYYARMFRHQIEEYLKIAQEKNWVVTGGSDFHGSIKPRLNLGASFVTEDDFQKLLSVLSEKRSSTSRSDGNSNR
jgi:predicted metal-dependent phosphoesterase TrpH